MIRRLYVGCSYACQEWLSDLTGTLSTSIEDSVYSGDDSEIVDFNDTHLHAAFTSQVTAGLAAIN